MKSCLRPLHLLLSIAGTATVVWFNEHPYTPLRQRADLLDALALIRWPALDQLSVQNVFEAK